MENLSQSRVICLASPKGGSGKTLLSATFATLLSSLGKSTVMVDTDGATNGLTLLHLKEVIIHRDKGVSNKRKPAGVYELNLLNRWAEPVSLVSGVDLIPATYEFIDTERIDHEVFEICMRSLISELRKKYEYIIVDAQAGSDLYAQVAMSRSISDDVVIVSEYDPMSAAGVERLKGLLRDDLTYDRTWVLLNKMLPEFVKSFSDFMEIAKYISPIPWDADVVRSYAHRKIALDLIHGNEHTIAVIQSIRSLLGDEIGQALDKWTASRAEMLREPILNQFMEQQSLHKSLVKRRIDLEYQERRSLSLRISVTMTTIILILISIFISQSLSFGYNKIIFVSLMFFVFFGFLTTLFWDSKIIQTLLSMVLRLRDPAAIKLELALLRREESAIEERLRKLESVKSAELETLWRTKQAF